MRRFITLIYHNLFIVNLQYISSTQQMIYLLNFQYNIYNYFATCFDSSESSSGIKFKTCCMYCFTVFLSYSVFLLQKGSPFFALQTRFNVYLVLGGGFGSCSQCPLSVFWGFFSLVILPVALLFGYGVRSC